jgi:hypothetical protein
LLVTVCRGASISNASRDFPANVEKPACNFVANTAFSIDEFVW